MNASVIIDTVLYARLHSKDGKKAAINEKDPCAFKLAGA